MRPPQFGVVGFYDRLAGHAEFVTRAEELGYDLVAWGDTQNLAPEMFVGLTVAAVHTERVRILSTVTNPVTRHPAVMASGAAGIQQLSSGRFQLGIATGDSALRNIGERPARLAELADYVAAVRDLCAGRAATWHGVDMQLHWDTRPVPIWIAAEGPRTIELAGRIADGVILGGGIDPDVVHATTERLDAAARRAGRDPEAIERWWLVKPYLADPGVAPEEIWRELAWTLAATANHVFRSGMDDKNIPAELRPAIQRLLEGYRSSEHNRPGSGVPHNATLIDDDELLAHLGRRFMIAGDPPTVAARLREVLDAGASNLLIPAVYDDNIGYIEQLWNDALGRLRTAT